MPSMTWACVTGRRVEICFVSIHGKKMFAKDKPTELGLYLYRFEGSLIHPMAVFEQDGQLRAKLVDGQAESDLETLTGEFLGPIPCRTLRFLLRQSSFISVVCAPPNYSKQEVEAPPMPEGVQPFIWQTPAEKGVT